MMSESGHGDYIDIGVAFSAMLDKKLSIREKELLTGGVQNATAKELDKLLEKLEKFGTEELRVFLLNSYDW